ncbi:hypothetical protein D3C75_688200 [compost metagenome]
MDIRMLVSGAVGKCDHHAGFRVGHGDQIAVALRAVFIVQPGVDSVQVEIPRNGAALHGYGQRQIIILQLAGNACFARCQHHMGIFPQQILIRRLGAETDGSAQLLMELLLQRFFMPPPEIGMPQAALHNGNFLRPVDGHGADHVDGMEINAQFIGQIGHTILGRSGRQSKENLPVHKPVPHLGTGFVYVRRNAVLF